jgi:hypothetical protein
MSINMRNDKLIPKNIPTDSDAHDETVASQEEIYLEKREEKLRATLISEDPSAYAQQGSVCVDCCFVNGSLDEELDHAAEELITGDADDPPLSEDAVVQILRMTSSARRLDAESRELIPRSSWRERSAI